MGQRQGTILKKCTCAPARIAAATRVRYGSRPMAGRELRFTDELERHRRRRSGVGRQLAKTRS